MSGDERLATIYGELAGLGLPCLVMGGHAVRFYGVDRSTLDFDFHLALEPEAWAKLPSLLAKSPTFSRALEGTTWRPRSFRRFIVGTLADGREERAEFWRDNHLLAPFPELAARSEVGLYGGGRIAFLGLDDLIRSKETEREDDWRDVRLLEEIADERRLTLAKDFETLTEAVARLRSQRGVARAAERDEFGLASAAAWPRVAHPLSAALLRPYAGNVEPLQIPLPAAIREVLDGPLRNVSPGSARHHAVAEAVRRLYIRSRMEEDRADKERARTAG